jgi:hypothetical protein
MCVFHILEVGTDGTYISLTCWHYTKRNIIYVKVKFFLCAVATSCMPIEEIDIKLYAF